MAWNICRRSVPTLSKYRLSSSYLSQYWLLAYMPSYWDWNSSVERDINPRNNLRHGHGPGPDLPRLLQSSELIYYLPLGAESTQDYPQDYPGLRGWPTSWKHRSSVPGRGSSLWQNWSNIHRHRELSQFHKYTTQVTPMGPFQGRQTDPKKIKTDSHRILLHIVEINAILI